MGIELDSKPEFDWLRLRLGKANAVGPAFLTDFGVALENLPPAPLDAPARPLLVTGDGNAFSAGLELPALIDLDRAGMAEFLARFDRVFRAFAQLERPTIAVVNGHAVAGGAILAMAADYRLAADSLASGKSYLIGLREAALGISLPAIAATITEEALGRAGAALDVVLTGSLYSPAEALVLGIVHKMVPASELMHEAENAGKRYAQSTGRASAILKRRWRAALWIAPPHSDDDVWLDTWFSPEAQRRIRAVVDSLRK